MSCCGGLWEAVAGGYGRRRSTPSFNDQESRPGISINLVAFDRQTGGIVKSALFESELTDWMAAQFSGPFIQFMGKVDPFKDADVPDRLLETAATELELVRRQLRRTRSKLIEVESPRTRKNGIEVKSEKLKHSFSREIAEKQLTFCIDLLHSAKANGHQVVSVGD